ncbi:hypothetical protein EI94DRAFT_1801565 [Lactarius quietus]|nr:hypothetical protein EI94DRAFT_1801565 [Lactarius quietus]
MAHQPSHPRRAVPFTPAVRAARPLGLPCRTFPPSSVYPTLPPPFSLSSPLLAPSFQSWRLAPHASAPLTPLALFSSHPKCGPPLPLRFRNAFVFVVLLLQAAFAPPSHNISAFTFTVEFPPPLAVSCRVLHTQLATSHPLIALFTVSLTAALSHCPPSPFPAPSHPAGPTLPAHPLAFVVIAVVTTFLSSPSPQLRARGDPPSRFSVHSAPSTATLPTL